MSRLVEMGVNLITIGLDSTERCWVLSQKGWLIPAQFY
jgi:hypothetical protein